jgi:hypothetical protein
MDEILMVIAMDVHGSAEGVGCASTMVASPVAADHDSEFPRACPRSRSASAFSSLR